MSKCNIHGSKINNDCLGCFHAMRSNARKALKTARLVRRVLGNEKRLGNWRHYGQLNKQSVSLKTSSVKAGGLFLCLKNTASLSYLPRQNYWQCRTQDYTNKSQIRHQGQSLLAVRIDCDMAPDPKLIITQAIDKFALIRTTRLRPPKAHPDDGGTATVRQQKKFG